MATKPPTSYMFNIIPLTSRRFQMFPLEQETAPLPLHGRVAARGQELVVDEASEIVGNRWIYTCPTQ